MAYETKENDLRYANLLKQTSSLIYEVDIHKENWAPSFISESVQELTGHTSDDFLFLFQCFPDINCYKSY